MFRKVNHADKHYNPQILNVLVDINEHGRSLRSAADWKPNNPELPISIVQTDPKRI